MLGLPRGISFDYGGRCARASEGLKDFAEFDRTEPYQPWAPLSTQNIQLLGHRRGVPVLYSERGSHLSRQLSCFAWIYLL
jgi:lipoprotein NlpI